jgi:hypothetical protein
VEDSGDMEDSGDILSRGGGQWRDIEATVESVLQLSTLRVSSLLRASKRRCLSLLLHRIGRL